MTRFVKISSEFGIILRKSAIVKKGLSLEKVFQTFEYSKPLDENDSIISYGPHFGEEAMEEFGRRLSKLGFEYLDDFFYFRGDFPEWAEFFVGSK